MLDFIMLVAAVLFLFRKIYGEVVGAIPQWWCLQCTIEYIFQETGFACGDFNCSIVYHSSNIGFRRNALLTWIAPGINITINYCFIYVYRASYFRYRRVSDCCSSNLYYSFVNLNLLVLASSWFILIMD
jgi:hypothetical protein